MEPLPPGFRDQGDYCAHLIVNLGYTPKNALERAFGTKAKDDCKEDRWYFITLTQPDTSKDWTRLEKTVRRVLGSKQVAPEEWAYCKEWTESKTPHIHIRLRTYKYIDYRVIRKFNDNYRADVQLEKLGCYDYIADATKSHPPGLWFFKSDNYTGPVPVINIAGTDIQCPSAATATPVEASVQE